MITEFLRRYKKTVYIVVGLILLAGAIFTYQMLQFRITSISPSNRNYPSSLSVVEVGFNRELNKSDLEKRVATNAKDVVSANFSGDIKASVDGSKLTITFARTPLAGDYEIELHNIMSADGSVLNKRLALNVKDIEYADMTDAEKKLYDADTPITDDEYDAEYPIFTKLPRETNQYIISYKYTGSDPAPTLTVTMKFFPPGNNAIPATDAEQAEYLSQLRTYRTEAVKWIESQGASINDYIMQYTEPELQDEFPAGRGKYFETGSDTTTNEETNR